MRQANSACAAAAHTHPGAASDLCREHAWVSRLIVDSLAFIGGSVSGTSGAPTSRARHRDAAAVQIRHRLDDSPTQESTRRLHAAG
jgi:hypothetical protein